RQEGIFFGVVAFSGKAASGAGSLIAGLALDVIAWPAGAGATAIPAETIRDLGIVYGPLVAVFAVLAPIAYRGYKLDRARHQAILAALAARR
ncbi:MAG: MFS transporter, partial [Myxococcota bacterium]